MAAIIKHCTCTGTPATEFQDRIYGKGMRVHNESEDKKKATCTCCKSKK